MKKDSILNALTPIFREVFQDSALNIKEDTIIGEIPLFDDMRYAKLIECVEHAFNIKFRLRQLSDIRTVADLIDCIV